MSAALSLLLASLLAPASLAGAWKTYVVLHVDGTDDAPVLAAALASGNYSENATILFEKGITYNVFTPITFPKLTNVEVAVEGNLTYPEEIKTVQGISLLYSRWLMKL